MKKKNEVEQFAKKFNKKYGNFTYSGEMALEVALKHIDVKDKKVIIQNNVCHRVLLSILRSGGIPILVKPKNEFVIDEEDLRRITKKYRDIAAVIIIHQYGIEADLKSIKKSINGKNIKIIEDIAQSWGIHNIGKFSDYVITSFAKSKQLSFGIGGGIFTDFTDINTILDINFRTSRATEKEILPYVLPSNIKISYRKMCKIGDQNIRRQINNAKAVNHIIISDYKKINCLAICKGVWNRYPVWTNDYTEYQKIIKTLDLYNIKYELPHKKSLDELPMLQRYKYFREINDNDIEYIVLIKVRNLKKRSIIKWKLKK